MEDNQDSYRSIIENHPDAFTYQRILTDSGGSPINSIFIDANPAFENMTGLSKGEVAGKKITDIFPEVKHSGFDWIGTLGKAALTGEVICMEQHVEMLNCRCEITAYSTDRGYFVLILRDITKYMNKNEVKYKELVENLNEVIYTLDENANITYISPNIEWISGYTPAEVIHRPFTDFVYPKDLKGRIEQFSKIMSGINEATEYRFVLKDGSTAWVRTAARPVIREGRPVGVQGILADITERKKIEEMLKESELKYRRLFEESPVSLWELDFSEIKNRIDELKQEGVIDLSTYFGSNPELVKELVEMVRFEDVNQVTLKLYKAKTKEEFFSGIKKILFEQFYDTFFDLLLVVAEGSTKFYSEKRHVTLDRKILDVQVYWSVVLGYEKTYSKVLASVVDITGRKRMERELKESEEKYRFIADNVTDVILEADSEGIITYASPSHYSVFGRKGNPVGQSTFKHLYLEDLKKVQQAFEKALKKNTTVRVEYRYFHPEKGYIWLEATGRKYFDQKGDIKMLMSIRDINKRKQAEERMRYMSFHDQMTGLYNRAYLEEEIKRLDTEKKLPVSVIMADLNGLKLVNDTYGHSKGDEMLKAAAEILKDSCRKEDVIARWGGDEFVILLPRTELEKTQNICRRIRDKLPGVYVEDIPVSISLGAAVKDNIEKPLAEVFKEAEDIMYKNKLVESQSAKSTALNALLKTLEEKSFETEKHVRRMQDTAEKIGRKLNLTDSELNRLNLLIKLHDIGKINISEEMLTKKGPLTDEEWEIIKKHPEVGYRIARATEEFSHVAEEILLHHERWDGTGYPRGLKGEEIPLLARIVAVADAYEVMSNGRPYKEPMSLDEIKTEFKKCAGTQFDPRLVEVFLQIIDIQSEQCKS